MATITRDHVTLAKGQLVFEYLAKGAKQREQAVAEDRVCAAVQSLLRRRQDGDHRYEAGHTIAATLGVLGQDSRFGDLATTGRAEAAVVKLLARDPRAAR